MHIPDGFLGPRTCAATWTLMLPVWWITSRAVRRNVPREQVANIGIAAAFVFVLMMFNIPIPGGTSGHALGTALVTIVLGLPSAILALSFALLLQALIFADGGVTTYAANCLDMAVTQAVVATLAWRALRPPNLLEQRTRGSLAAFAAAYIASLIGAAVAGTLLGLQPLLERDAAGLPKYFPLGLHIVLPAMLFAHLFVGILEGLVTAGALLALAKMPEMAVLLGSRATGPESPKRWSRLLATAAALIIAVPLGLHLPEWLGASGAWGEWDPSEAARIAGLVDAPSGMQRMWNLWSAPLPDYAVSPNSGTVKSSAQYTGAATLGVLITIGAFLLLGRRRTKTA